MTGRNQPLPGALLEQLTSGHVKFRLNEELSRDEVLRRGDRIRSAAIEACHWLDAHDGLRRALAAKSRPPHYELIREGAVVYVYDPPIGRKGLARRSQDNVSWTGPAVVVCVERDQTVPKKIWVRIRTKVKAYPLEKIRLATADEMVSAEFITDALKEVEAELGQGQFQVFDREKKTPKETRGRPPKRSGDIADHREEQMSEGERDQQRVADERKRSLLHDVPDSVRKAIQGRGDEAEDPSAWDFAKKQRLYEGIAGDLMSQTAMQEAEVRSRLEKGFQKVRVRKKVIAKALKESRRQRASGPVVSAASSHMAEVVEALQAEVVGEPEDEVSDDDIL